MKHVKSVSARFFTATVVMASVMVIVATRFVPAIAAAADLGRTVHSKGDGATAGSVPPVPPCTFDLSLADHCKGLLNSDPITRAMLKSAEDYLVHDPNMEEESYRHGNCFFKPDCYNALYAKTLVMKDARAVSLENLPDTKRVLIGAIAINTGATSDDVEYNVGAALPADKNKRTLYFIAESTPNEMIGTNKKVIARWTLYGYATPDAKDITPLKDDDGDAVSGRVIMCLGTAETDPKPHAAGFYSCEHVKPAHRFAVTHHISLADVRNAFACERTTKEGSKAAIREACKTEVRDKLTSLLKERGRIPMTQNDRTSFTSALKKLTDAALNSSSDPYWFSCSVGCCTASN